LVLFFLTGGIPNKQTPPNNPKCYSKQRKGDGNKTTLLHPCWNCAYSTVLNCATGFLPLSPPKRGLKGEERRTQEGVLVLSGCVDTFLPATQI